VPCFHFCSGSLYLHHFLGQAWQLASAHSLNNNNNNNNNNKQVNNNSNHNNKLNKRETQSQERRQETPHRDDLNI
jgi:hypothetical protein